MKNPEFNLEDLSRLSLCRNNDPMGFNCETKPLSHYTSKMTEELGEICGAIAKLERGWNPREKRKLVQKLKDKWEEKHPGMEHMFVEAPDSELREVWILHKLSDFREECADLFLILDLVMTRTANQYFTGDLLGSNLSLFPAVRNKFNKVSRELNPNTTYII